MPPRSPRLIYLSTFILAGSILLFEIALTRVFSVLTWHHFTHMIISVALLGSGAAGAYLTLRRTGRAFSPQQLSRYALLYALTTILAVLGATRIWFDSPYVWTQLLSIALYYGLLLVPFFFAGLCIAGIIASYRADINRVYAADLLGASAGSLASVFLIYAIGATNTIALVALLAGCAAWLLRRMQPEGRPAGHLLALGALTLLFLAGLVLNPYLVYAPAYKEISLLINPQAGTAELAWSRWHTVARVDVTEPVLTRAPDFGGNLNRDIVTPWEYRMVFQDGAAGTLIFQSDGDLSKMPFLGHYLQAAPYQILTEPRVLVIGVGGGPDIFIAQYHQAAHVTGVDVNPAMVQAVTEVYAEYAGGVLTAPNVEILVAEGRHFVSQDPHRYQLIQLTGVDTFSALASGAFALAENYIYTVEAVHDYWHHLTPDGIVSFARWYFIPPRETLRLIAAMVEAMDQLGVPDPSWHIVLIAGDTGAETMLKKSPYTEEEIATLRRWAEENGFTVLYDPLSTVENEFATVIRADRQEREAFYRHYVFNVRPATDDSPFFFDYYKWSNLFNMDPEWTQYGYVVNKMPLGRITILLNLAQVLIFAGVGILLPLRRHRRDLFARPGSLAALAYFSALGLGFMLVEITLIQRLMVFLGGPTYAVSIVLFSVLLFSGLGSFVARRWDFGSGRRLLLLAAAVCGLILAVNWVLPWAVTQWLGYSLAVRGLLAVLLIAPLALVMGMPFPTGIGLLSRHTPAWIPWAWGANAFMTVLGTLLCVLLSMSLGFSWVFIIACLIYLLGFLALTRFLARAPGKTAPEATGGQDAP